MQILFINGPRSFVPQNSPAVLALLDEKFLIARILDPYQNRQYNNIYFIY